MARQPKSAVPRERSNPEKSFNNTHFKPMSAKNDAQKRYFAALENYKIVYGVGPAGTGKTAISVAHACAQLYAGHIEKIVITRPMTAACGENIGYLPGDVSEKQEPYLRPVRAIMEEVLGKGAVEMFIKNEQIIGIPLAFCRGMTFNRACIIVDEAQNTSKEQMLMILTRMGIDSKIFVNGDGEQSDVFGVNGLEDAIKRTSWIPECKVITFSLDDIVRSYLISDIIKSYRDNVNG